ncbi:MAG: helix-turn-helix transcriptional regulator, partial [Candidatus Competibacteraceae bacterium]|nr:helix-turn-helix transcriptional regulator [Candidatus Competibacteraceae bacterium]
MSAGRKRAFDKAEALDKAMRVFWENGYSGTSVTDLTAALGINKPSMYAAFG